MIKLRPRRYSIIYADPNWKYKDQNTGGSFSSGSENHYPTMSVEDLAQINVPAISHDDSFLFMWTTGPFLLDGSATFVMKEWGFIPKCVAFIWLKLYSNGNLVNGLGHYTRSSAEYVLLGKRGRPERYSASVMQVLEEYPETFRLPRLRHSEKPPEIRNRIIELCGNLPRIEMFSRHDVAGWDRHGIELLP